MTDLLDLTDRQRIHCLGLEARVHELRTQLADAERPSPQAIREAYERGRLEARVALEHLTRDLRSLADRIDEATQQTSRQPQPERINPMTDQKLKIDFANPVLIDLDGTRWIADRYVAIRCDATDLTTEALDELPVSRSIDHTKRPYSARNPQTDGPIGPNLAALLWVNHDDRGIMLTVHDSDKPGMYAICLDGDMIGFATVPVPTGDEVWTPTIDQLPKALAVAREISRYVWDLDPSLWETGNPAGTMAAAYGAIMACYTEDPSHD